VRRDHEIFELRVVAVGAHAQELVAGLAVADGEGQVGEGRSDLGVRQRQLDQLAQGHHHVARVAVVSVLVRFS
jgi:hypothetical protein